MSRRAREVALVLGALLAVAALRWWAPLLGRAAFVAEDLPILNVPVRAYLGMHLREGILPLWTPLLQNGFPLFAESQMGATYPLRWLHALPIEPAVAVAWAIVLHLAWAGAGLFGYLRAVGLRRAAALVPAVALAFSPLLVVRHQHTNVLEALAWWPWLLWAVEAWLRRVGAAIGLGRRDPDSLATGGLPASASPGPSRPRTRVDEQPVARERGPDAAGDALADKPPVARDPQPVPAVRESGTVRRGAPYLFVGWAAGLMAMGGHVQYVLYGWTLALVYGVCRAGMLRVPWPRALGGAIAAGAVALGLAAAQYLPLAELAGHSLRAGGLGQWELADQAVRPQHLPLFVAPGFWGEFFRPGHTRPALAWEFVAYVGLLPLLLAAVGAAVAVRRGGGGVARFWLIVAIVALLGALGERFLVYRGLTLLPGWGSMRAPARLLSGYGLAVVALAGWGIEAVLARRWRWPALGVAAAAGYVAVVAAAAAVLPPKVEALAPGAGAASREALGLLLLFGTLALLWLQAAPRMAVRTAAGSAALLVLADVLLTGAALAPTADAAVYRLPTLGACRAAVPPGRGGGALAWYRPDTNLLTHQPNLFNMSPLSLRRPVELYDRAVEAGPRATANLLALLGVRVHVDDTGRLQPTPLTPRPMVWPAARVVTVDDVDAAVEWLAERAFAPGDAAMVVGDAPTVAGAGGRALTFAERANRAYYNVEADGDAFWVINTTAYPGRSAWVDGRPAKLWRTNAVQVGVSTGPGRHTIGVVFDSLTIRLGRFIFLMTLALSAGWLVVGRGRRD